MAELTAWCPSCTRIGKTESAAKKCPECGFKDREACFVTPCDGSACAGDIFHRPEGLDFWVFDNPPASAPGVLI